MVSCFNISSKESSKNHLVQCNKQYHKKILLSLFIESLCYFTTGLEFAVETLKSFILAMAVIDNHLTVEKAVSLSRLELEFQVCVKTNFTLDTCRSSKAVTKNYFSLFCFFLVLPPSLMTPVTQAKTYRPYIPL